MKNAISVNCLVSAILLILLTNCRNSLENQVETVMPDLINTPSPTTMTVIEGKENWENTQIDQKDLFETEFGWTKRCGNREIVSEQTSFPSSYRILAYLSGSKKSYKTIGDNWFIQNLDLPDAYNAYVSPDGKWLSYWHRNEPDDPYLLTSIEFTSIADDKHYSIPWQNHWKPPVVSPWFSFEHIRFLDTSDDREPVEHLLTPQNEMDVLNWQELPDIDSQDTYLHAWVNPTLTHVFYATKPYFEGENVVRLYRLWDIQQEQVIWESPTDFLISSLEIVWAYDGSTIAFTGRYRAETTPDFQMYELYTLSNNGELKKMGAFADKFTRFSIRGLFWSPDSNKLFFSFADETTINTDDIATYPVLKPLVLEPQSGEIYNFCLEGGGGRHSWSPDSTLLAFISLFDQQERLIILNVETGDVYLTPFDICIASDCEPSEDTGLTNVLGWMAN